MIVSAVAGVEVVDDSLTAMVEVLSVTVVLLAGADVVTADDAVVEVVTEPLPSPVHAAVAVRTTITTRRAALDAFTNTLNAHGALLRKGPNTLLASNTYSQLIGCVAAASRELFVGLDETQNRMRVDVEPCSPARNRQ